MDPLKEQRYYPPQLLGKWFGISSLIFVGTIFWIFGNDYRREWKSYQMEFRRLEIEKTRVNLSHLEVDDKQKELLEANLAAAKDSLAGRQVRIIELENLLEKADGQYYGANLRHQGNTADLEVVRYRLERALATNKGIDRAQRAYQRMVDKDYRFQAVAEEQLVIVEDYQQNLKELRTDVKDSERELAALLRDVAILERKLTIIDPEEMTFANKVANVFRDLPVVDFLAPSLTINQIIVKDIRDNINFTTVPKVDRCTTCHLAIDKAGYEDAPQPFTTHPNLDRYLTTASPHPINEFGCTGCHAGRGRGTSFISAGHMPATLDQAHEWEEDYDWEPLEHWDEKMYPAAYSQAGCLKCHHSEPILKGAERLTLGLTIIEKASCFGCHQLDRYKGWDRRGPNLAMVAGKLEQDFIFKWVREPRSFRHNTWMPSFFNQSNTSDSASVHRADTEIHGIVHYLYAKSSELQLPFKLAVRGQVARGEALFESVGCLGCHVMEPEPVIVEATLERMMQRHGPNLIGLGSKVSADWLFNWLKEPLNYNPISRMPNLRLSDQEAADITAYLLESRIPEFEAMSVPTLDEAELDSITMGWMAKDNTLQRVRSMMAEMSLDDKLEYVGKRSILHYGCFSCHNLPGFEDAKPIGTPLTFEGSKPVHSLDFGSVHEIGHTNYNWFEAKLADPRIFDRHTIKAHDAKLRMPNFHFSEEEIAATVTALLGFAKADVGHAKLASQSAEGELIQRGLTVIKDYNCQGCHIIDGIGGQISEIIGDVAMSPPNLNTEGARVQPLWLFNFFKSPSTIRPNLKVRMPTYDFSDQTWNDIIKTFQYLNGIHTAFEMQHQVSTTSSSYGVGEFLASEDVGDCGKCHLMAGREPTGNRADWAMDLALTKHRLRPDWVVDWLRDPEAIMPGTKMPQPYIPTREDVDFEGAEEYYPPPVIEMAGDSQALLESLRDYVYTIGQ